MTPGELLTDEGEHALNPGRRTATVLVKNASDRPIQVGSHYHFAETNGALDFDRATAQREAQRCYLCHGPQVQMKNLRFDSPDSVGQHAQAIYQQVVVQKLMPMNNATGITDAERALIGRWFEAGAATGP